MPTARTKAGQFLSQEMRAKRKTAAPKPRVRRDRPVDTSLPTVSASDRKAARDLQGLSNENGLAGRRGGVVLEETSGKRSRKSTRRSADRTKTTTNLQNREVMSSRSPKARHDRNRIKKTSHRGKH